MKFDAAVIGGGPGGYTAAEAISGTGRSVVLFEKDLLGGTCLNRGCMPTKAMLRAAETFREMNSGHGPYCANIIPLSSRDKRTIVLSRQVMYNTYSEWMCRHQVCK